MSVPTKLLEPVQHLPEREEKTSSHTHYPHFVCAGGRSTYKALSLASHEPKPSARTGLNKCRVQLEEPNLFTLFSQDEEF